MAVAHFQVNGHQMGERAFPVPKRAGDLKYWYKAAQKAIPAIPDWSEERRTNVNIDVNVILWDWQGPHGERYSLYIARKRNMW